MSLQCFTSSFRTNELTVWEEMSFEEFQYGCHGGHLGDQNGTILAIVNMSLRCLPSTFGSAGPMVWEEMSFEEFNYVATAAILDMGRNYFSNSESL